MRGCSVVQLPFEAMIKHSRSSESQEALNLSPDLMAPKLMGKLESDPSGEPMGIQGQLFRGLILRNAGFRATPITSQQYNNVCVCPTVGLIYDPGSLRPHIFVSNRHIDLYTSKHTHTHAPIYTSTLIHLPPPLPTVQHTAGRFGALSPWKPGQYKSTTVYVCVCVCIFVHMCIRVGVYETKAYTGFHIFCCQRGGRQMWKHTIRS